MASGKSNEKKSSAGVGQKFEINGRQCSGHVGFSVSRASHRISTKGGKLAHGSGIVVMDVSVLIRETAADQ
jgi:hypothetical protein